MHRSPSFDRMSNWIVADPVHLGGSPRVRDTRISVAFLLESLAVGLSVAEIVGAYPSLTGEAVRWWNWRIGNTSRRALLQWFDPLIPQIVLMLENGKRLIELR